MNTTYTKFRSPQDVATWYNNYELYFPSDNDEDTDFLYALNIYTASANTPINSHLRYNSPIDSSDYLYPYFTSMITKLPTYCIPDNIIVYRYISKGQLKEMCPSYPPKKNMIMQDKGFMSTTLIKKSIDSFRKHNSLSILLVISVPVGTKGTYVGNLKDMLTEYEVILAPNTKLHIDKKIPFINSYIWCSVVN